MSGVLHPAGPEPAQTYWLRRVLVLLALLILVLVSVGVAGASMGATRPSTPAAVAPGAGDASSAAPTGSASATSSSSPDAGSSGSASKAPSADRSGTSGASPSTTSAPEKSGTSTAVTPACSRKELKTTLAGKQMLKLAKPAAFAVSVRNDGDETCRVNLTRADFELKVTSGKKVLWSSKACSTATFLVAAKLDLDQTMSWSMLWDGRGVAAGCAQPGAALKRGTYLASATVAGSKVAELPITLRP